METLIKNIKICELCGLCEKRTNAVPGEGNCNARIMIIGEAPGDNEDKTGLPFVGRSGHLLNRLLESVGLTRQDIFITNIVKCRPPGNRNPTPEEIDKCFPYLQEQIELIQPKMIITVGTFAAQTITARKEPISILRGRLFVLGKTLVVPTFHPAYALRNPSKEEIMLGDFKKALELV